MLHDYDNDLYYDGTGETWQRIHIQDAAGNNIMTVRTMNPDFILTVEEKYGSPIFLVYEGGTMDGSKTIFVY